MNKNKFEEFMHDLDTIFFTSILFYSLEIKNNLLIAKSIWNENKSYILK